ILRRDHDSAMRIGYPTIRTPAAVSDPRAATRSHNWVQRRDHAANGRNTLHPAAGIPVVIRLPIGHDDELVVLKPSLDQILKSVFIPHATLAFPIARTAGSGSVPASSCTLASRPY